MPAAIARVLGRGNNGGVVSLRPDGRVYKWTVDPVEVQCVLAIQSLREQGEPLRGFPKVFDVRLGRREALIVREDVKPLTRGTSAQAQRILPAARRDLQLGSRLITRSRRSPFRSRRPDPGVVLQNTALASQELQHVYDLVLRVEEVYGFRPLDLRAENIPPHGGRRDHARVLIDGGRTPIETLAVAPGEAYQRCPDEDRLVAAVRRLLGTSPKYGQCQIASAREMREVMHDHGWADAEIDGTAGFHTEGRPGDILIRRGDEWSVLHELIHAAGVVDRGMATWLCEAITEGTAQDIARAQGIPHHPTYPEEVELVRSRLIPPLQAAKVLPEREPMLALARMVVASPRLTTRRIVSGLRSVLDGAKAQWYAAVGPGSPGVEAMQTALKHAAITRHVVRSRADARAQGRFPWRLPPEPEPEPTRAELATAARQKLLDVESAERVARRAAEEQAWAEAHSRRMAAGSHAGAFLHRALTPAAEVRRERAEARRARRNAKKESAR